MLALQVECQIVVLAFERKVGENTTGVDDELAAYAIERISLGDGLAEGREREEGLVAGWMDDVDLQSTSCGHT